jgi:hypothetical protein
MMRQPRQARDKHARMENNSPKKGSHFAFRFGIGIIHTIDCSEKDAAKRLKAYNKKPDKNPAPLPDSHEAR